MKTFSDSVWIHGPVRSSLLDQIPGQIPLKAHLVGGLNPSEKILVNWDDYSQYMGK